jgi:N-acyl-D-amino-acid deacylase
MYKMRSFPHPTILVLIATFLLLVVLVLSGFVFFTVTEVDLLITNGQIVDGTGALPYVADVAIKDGRILGISRWRYRWANTQRQLDARGKIVAPGFIDVHTHVEANIPGKAAFRPENFLQQGITTIITGNCGRSNLKLGELFQALEKNGTYLNVASLIGHNSVRKEVMGTSAQPPTAHELARMEQIVDEALKDGALGFSTGLAYIPGRFADQAEIVRLARRAALQQGLYVSHIRDEADRGLEALKEALNIGQQAGVATHISHLKCSGRAQWHTASIRLALLKSVREQGLRVTLDAYPYDRSSTSTDLLLPDWAMESQREKLRQVPHNQDLKRRLVEDIRQEIMRNGWYDLTHIKLVAGRPEWIGRSLQEVPQTALGLEQQIDNLIAISLRGGAQAIYADMNEKDVQQVLANSFCVFGSDSAVRNPNGEYKPHPRGFGTFPRIFRLYVRDQATLTLSDAIRKASGQAAEIFGLEGRGILAVDRFADVVIFDLNRIADRADYDQPFAPPDGIAYVIVNGAVVVESGIMTKERPHGVVVRNGSKKANTLARKE